MNLLPHINGLKLRAMVRATSLALLGLLLACNGTPGGGAPLPTPVLHQLHVPMGNTWHTMPYQPASPGPFDVLPTTGGAARIDFSAPIGSVFAVSIREPAVGTITALPEGTAATAPAGTGFFEIQGVNPNTNPPFYTVYVRVPATLANSTNYDVLVVNRSMRNDATDSAAMVIMLRARPVSPVAGGGQDPGPVSTCPEPPILTGFTWIGQPQCGRISSTSDIRGDLQCDAQGYFCCGPSPAGGGGPTRCPSGATPYQSDCMHFGTRGALRQPGGCYEIE